MLKLYYHPLSSFCWKATIALYENDTPFEKVVVNLNEEKSRAAFLEIWPVGQFPVIRDEARDWMVPESSIIIEYLDQHYPGRTRFIPADPDKARQVRMRDRFFDLHVQVPMQHIMDDRWRKEEDKNRIGVEKMRTRITAALGMIEERRRARTGRWATTSPWPISRRCRRCSMRTSRCRSETRVRRQAPISARLEEAPVRRAHAEGRRAVPERRFRS